MTISHIQSFDSSIPVIDLNDFYCNKNKFVDEFGRALRKVGFVAVINSNIDKQKRDLVYEVSKRFFSQELSEKQKIQKMHNSGERGYVNFESPKESSIDGRDAKEFLHIGRELAKDELERFGYPENLWPESKDFKGPILDLYNNLIAFIPTIAETAALALGESASLLTDKMENGDHLLRLIHYPVTLAGKWAAEHSDLNLLTFLPPATCEGLQVKTENGDWIPVNVPDNAVIVNCGDMLQNLTNGEFRSAVHRVENPLGKERYSIVMFSHTKNDSNLEPLATCIERTGGISRYPKANRKELLEYYLVALGRASDEMKYRVRNSGIIARIGILDNFHALKINEKVIQILSDLK